MTAGYVSVRVVDETGKQLDSDVVLAYYAFSPLYDVISALVRVSTVGELFELSKRGGFKVRFSREEVAWKVEHYQYSAVKGVLRPHEDGGFLLEVVVPALKGELGERALLGAWRAQRACGELRGELEKLRERVSQLEDGLKELRAMVEGVNLKVEMLSRARESEEVGEEQE